MSSTLAATMPEIADGAVVAYLIFDVADTIDLEAISKMASVQSERAQLRFYREGGPNYIKFPVPPLSISLGDLILLGKKANARLKIFDYGVMSVRIEIPFSGTWAELFDLSVALRRSPDFFTAAKKYFDDAKAQMHGAFRKPHAEELVEDYFVFSVHEFKKKVSSRDLLTAFSREVAALIRGEAKPLAKEEVEEALRASLAYLEDDLCIVEWDVAFVYDRPDAVDTIEQILEFANTQLVELRTYDSIINAELDWIYTTDPVHHSSHGFFAHRAANQRANRLRMMLVDVGELMERTNNALKIIGDAFYARVYRQVRNRLALGEWEKQINNNLGSVNSIYRFLTDQAQNERGEVLEWIVIILIATEIVMGLLRH